ncbi:MAG: polysaccharide export protein [Myxococcales bacterium]|jgi:protein involved in polysaccharide export with SLBB domain|nr:polysaccharide export protein [Myxococcales bacterium]
MTQGGERLSRRGRLGGLRRLSGWAVALAVASACSGCGSSLPYVWVQDVVPPKAPSADAPIQAGDTITVFVQEQEGLSGDFLVGADGSYVQPILGAVHVAGRTPDQVQRHLTERLRGILAEPLVSVAVATRRPIRIGVIGEVLQPGYFELGVDEGILSGLARAGGLNDFADEDEIFVIRRHPELQRIRVRYRELMRPEHAAARFRLLDGDTIVVE